MEFNLSGIQGVQPIIAVFAGILILAVPRLLPTVVALYLILTGLIGLGLIALG